MIKYDCSKCLFSPVCDKKRHFQKKCKHYVSPEGLSPIVQTMFAFHLISKMLKLHSKLIIEEFIDDET